MSELAKVSCPAIIAQVSTKADGSIKIVLETPELASGEMEKLFNLRKDQGYFLFAAQALTEADIPKESMPEINEKTPSQRLRAVLYRIWEQAGKKGTFEQYYRVAMEKLIEHMKERLE